MLFSTASTVGGSVSPPRAAEVYVATDAEAFDRGIEAGQDGWTTRYHLNGKLVVEFCDETETTYTFASSELEFTFIEYMDK